MFSKRIVKAEAPVRAAGSQGAGRKPGELSPGAEVGAATSEQTKSEDRLLMERVVERSNMRLAYERVVRNKGTAGDDGVAVSELKDWLVAHWPSVKEALLAGRYMPQPVRRVDIPKPSGGEDTRRADGGRPADPAGAAPVLQPLFEPTFSDGSSASGRVGALAMRCVGLRRISVKASAGWWTLIWRSSSIG